MKILVCVKQVPESGSSFIVDDSQKWIYKEPLSYKMNRFDESALEEALSIRDRYKSVGFNLSGSVQEKAAKLIHILRQKSFIN